ncbi:MAG: alkaline phosphatase family protein [Actinomycetota bacterium]
MRRLLLVCVVTIVFAAACTSSDSTPAVTADKRGIFKLDHLIFVVMENRSFDHYFGTYPGADGLPEKICVPHPAFGGKCMHAYHDTDFMDEGGPHTKKASDEAVNGGKMDGFIRVVYDEDKNPCAVNPSGPGCRLRVGPQGQPEVMGYHTRDEIPNYWAYADEFVLQDRMFAPTDSWTLPAHLYLVSGWSASCRSQTDPMSCRSDIGGEGSKLRTPRGPEDTPYAWTDITYLLHENGVSWSYYIAPGGECEGIRCDKRGLEEITTDFQNPLPGFRTVLDNNQRENIRPYTEFFAALGTDRLPSVSWIMPAIGESDHPGHSSIADGQEFVTDIVNSVMQSSAWERSAIFVTWDDWGGFYDHVKPPRIDMNGYGIRVPGLLISPYAKRGYIDHQLHTFDSYLKLIEDRFLGSERLDPDTLSRPDSRPTVREAVEKLGDLQQEFDFTQEPRPPVILDSAGPRA